MMARLGDAWRRHAWRGPARRRLARAMAAILSAAIALPVEAAPCHHFSRWYYPFPQRCGAARQMTRLAPAGPTWTNLARSGPRQEPSIPLPSLARADLDGGAADEPTRARLLLRAALGDPDAH